jgi:hypothetical protein
VNRPQYIWEREEVDPVTGEVKRVFPTHKRVLRQLWFMPFAALAGLALGTVLLVTFAIEALMSDVYGSVLADRWVCLTSSEWLVPSLTSPCTVSAVPAYDSTLGGVTLHDLKSY